MRFLVTGFIDFVFGRLFNSGVMERIKSAL